MGGKGIPNYRKLVTKETVRTDVDSQAELAQRPPGLLTSGKINKLTGNKLTKGIEWKS